MGPIDFKPSDGVWLSRLVMKNFRSIASLDLAFRYRLTVLIGDNGAGKTTVLDAIAVLLSPSRQARPYGFDSADARQVGGIVAGATRLDLTVADHTSWIEFGGPTGPQSRSFPPSTGKIWRVSAHYPAQRDTADFEELSNWFAEKDVEEALEMRETQDLNYRHPHLESVRRAVSAMIPGAFNLRIERTTKELIVDQAVGGGTETFAVSRLAGGLRAMLYLVADLAKLLVSFGDRADESSAAIVLIDEIDLHLHPRWQLEVVKNLLRAFPNTQFIVTTHSEEIIASVPSACVVSLETRAEGVVAQTIPAVQGATFDRVLTDAMQVPTSRPPEVQALLDEYWRYVDGGEVETARAVELRRQLDELFRGTEPELIRADLAIRRNRARRGIGA